MRMTARAAATIAATVFAAVTLFAVTNRSEPLAQRLGTTPVVVELFTSQGCSSCPPADALIASIAHDESLRGRVIPLAFHVDYWDHLGWRDPFSSRAGTQRQMIYVHNMRLNSAYTPQAVVAGRREFIGSSSGAIGDAIVEASHSRPFGTVAVQAKREGDTIVADIKAVAPEADVMLAVVEYDVTTNVKAGENEGRSLVNDAIVRSLGRVAPGRTAVKVDPSWKQLGVVVFLQDRGTLAITNAAAARL